MQPFRAQASMTSASYFRCLARIHPFLANVDAATDGDGDADDGVADDDGDDRDDADDGDED